MEVDNLKHAENLIKMKAFHNESFYPYDKLNNSKGVIRSM